MGNYHPHGDSAIYDALARMAQDWSLRVLGALTPTQSGRIFAWDGSEIIP